VIQASVAQEHSALVPAGPQAWSVDRLGNAMYATSAIVFVLVVGFLLYGALRRRAADRTPPGEYGRGTLAAVVCATGATIAILLFFLVVDVRTGTALNRSPISPVRIEVTGYQWWWEVKYPGAQAGDLVTTANEIHVPVGHPVTVTLKSDDVIHSFWPPSLTPKRDLIPGKVRTISFEAARAGVYRGQCAEYCGHQHAKMAFLVVAESPDRFSGWLAAQRDTAVAPSDTLAQRGRDVFVSGTCAMCHAIEGTPAGSHVGPDLTHVMSRSTLAAGTLRNTPEARAAWVTNPQRIKPGTRMPPSDLAPEDLRAVLAYLETLR
jgi:cytochrome c oxidase subunit II